jgi:hypothetical protein
MVGGVTRFDADADAAGEGFGGGQGALLYRGSRGFCAANAEIRI